MHPEHRALLETLNSNAQARPSHGFDAQRYLGAELPVLNIDAPGLRAIAKAWVKTHKAAPPRDVLAVMDSLFGGASHTEKALAAILLGYHHTARAAVTLAELDQWLGRLVGWAEVDAFCSNVFTAEELLADWPAWRGLIDQLAGDPNINKRRAALVLLTGPVRYSGDARLSALAFATIERLKAERPILITKAVSWLLRALTIRHKAEVAAYLDAQAASLPAIAVRETRTKLATGRKSGKAQSRAIIGR